MHFGNWLIPPHLSFSFGLESCGLSVAGCEDLSLALISNKRLTHLCLAGNVLGDSGVKLMSDALKHPPCTLQSLVWVSASFLPSNIIHILKYIETGKILWTYYVPCFFPRIFNDNEDDEDDDINNCHLFCPYFVLGPAQNLFNLNRSTYWCQIGHLSSKCLTEQVRNVRLRKIMQLS